MWQQTEVDYLVQRLLNPTGSAEGTSIPLPQQGDFRVPPVTSLKVATTNALVGSTQYILTWDEPENISPFLVSHFLIYATQVTISGIRSSAPVATNRSPGVVELTVAANTVLIFKVQTVLTNGQVNDLDTAPSATHTASVQSITPATLNTGGIFVDGLTLTSNSPASGRIAWSAHTIYYLGNTYNISSGSTASSTEVYVYWTVGNTTLTSAASYTPASNIFQIATSTGGTADTAWNKVARSGIQETNLGFGLIKGLDCRLATVSQDINGLGSATTYTILNYSSGAGGLLSVGIVNTNISGTGTSPTYELWVTVDGGTKRTYKLNSSGSWDTEMLGTNASLSGVGNATGDFANIVFGAAWDTSILVELRIVIPASVTSQWSIAAIMNYGTA